MKNLESIRRAIDNEDSTGLSDAMEQWLKGTRLTEELAREERNDDDEDN